MDKSFKLIDKLFFELIQVAIGARVCLSHTPTADEWGVLYAIAKKQSLVGVCFAGVQRLVSQHQNPPEMLYLKWMGMAAKIQQKNEVVNRQCAELTERFAEMGFRSCVQKGQGVAALYEVKGASTELSIDPGLKVNDLSALRQSGDIDIWVDGDMDVSVKVLSDGGVKLSCIDSVHAHAECFTDTEVETHFRPSWMYNRGHEKVFMDFCELMREEQFANHDEGLGFAYPTVRFNLVFLLLHINRHIFESGIGLRQLMDYYFALMASTADERKEAIEVLKGMGLARFTAGIMHIERAVFGLDETMLLCAPDDREGQFLMKDMLRGGNFGKYDERNVATELDERWKRGWYTMLRSVRYLMHYPSEVLAIPGWKLRHYVWRKRKGYI